MDCVSCEKCRLWGKIQISGTPCASDLLGIGTALKILFSNVYGVPLEMKLRRCEVVALLNAFGRISESIGAVGKFASYYESPLVFYGHNWVG